MTAIDIRLALEAWADNGNLDRDHIPEIAREIASLVLEAVAIDDDTIVRLMRDNLPAKVVDELTFERHPPLFPQATYDVPTYGMECFVKAILAIRPQPASTALVERLTKALEETLAFAEAMGKHSGRGVGGRRGGPIFSRARSALSASQSTSRENEQ